MREGTHIWERGGAVAVVLLCHVLSQVLCVDIDLDVKPIRNPFKQSGHLEETSQLKIR